MDERHWWIAQHIGHTFRIDLSIQTNNAFMESFICNEETLDKINGFLCMNGTNKIFFCCVKDELVDRNILVLDSLLKLPKSMSQNIDAAVILYFIRHDTNQEISQAYIHKEVYCGEIKNISHVLFNIYNDLLLPSFKQNRDWGSCDEQSKTQIIHNMEKYVNSMGTVLQDTQSSKNLLLRRVSDPEVLNELKQPRLTTESPVIKYCEDLALDWINTIENILSDICDERFIHPSVGPLSELERWQRKQRLLSSLTEQLKTKECKSIISGLIGVKSKVLKKWKVVDTGITDAQNECRDKVKFLESLKRPIDQFYQEATPQTCMNTALPGLCTAMRTIESVSRYYARQGYLGLLFTKVTNQVVNILKEYVSELAILVDNEEQFWPIILKEIEENGLLTLKDVHNPQSAVSGHASADKKSVYSESKTARSSVKDSKETEQLAVSEGLFTRLKTCLLVQARYKDVFRTLRDGLGGSQALSSFPSVSSLQTSDQSSAKETARNKTQSTHRRTNESKNHGILMSEEDVIFGHMDTFCTRVKHVIDEMTTLSQYQTLAKTSIGLSRPKKEDLGIDYGTDDEDDAGKDNDDDTSDELNDTDDDLNDAESFNEQNHGDSMYFSAKNKSMDPVVEEDAEEEEEEESTDQESARSPGKKPAKSSMTQRTMQSKNTRDEPKPLQNSSRQEQQNEFRNDAAENLFKTERRVEEDARRILKKAQTLSKEDLRVLRKYYNRQNEGPTVTAITNEFLAQLVNAVKSVSAKYILDVETKDAVVFDEMHKNFMITVVSLERYLAAYLNVIFLKEKKTQEGLNMLIRFESVNQRNILRPIINDKYVEMFANYEKDLDQTQSSYEEMKANPPVLRNAPPFAGAISWVRQLLKNIEEPIRLFQANKYIANLGDFQRITKKYNRLAAILIAYETLYLNQWKSTIDEAKLGLKAHLLCQDPVTKKLMVNFDTKLLQLFHESKWLKRMGIEIPNQAQDLLSQEKKYKEYKSNLEMLFNDFETVKARMPQHLLGLYDPHLKQTLDVCNPGVFILTWNSLNIDAFLKTFEVAITKLNSLVTQVQGVKEKEIMDIITEINATCLFDYTLAFSKRWGCQEFTKLIDDSIMKTAEKLSQKLENIESNIYEIGNLLVIVPKEGSNSTRRKSKLNIKDLMDLEPKLAFLKEYYAILLFDSFYSSVNKSLRILAESSGYKFDETMTSLDELNNDEALERNLVEKSYDFENDSDADRFRNVYLSTARTKSAVSHISSHMDQRPMSTVSALSRATWTSERKFDESYLNLELVLKYQIPEVAIEPDLNETQKAIKTIAFNCVEITKRIKWKHPDSNRSFYETICKSPDMIQLLNVFNTLTDDIRPTVKQHINHFKLFDFLWKEDLNNLFNEFMKYDPGEAAIKREVERLVKVEQKVLSIPDYLNVGPVCLKTDAVRSSLKSFAFQWKSKYASIMHQLAKTKLQAALVYRENVQKRLSVNVQTLEQLNDALKLLEELSDMENKIDKIYLPIENMYDDLRRFDLLLTREELDQVTTLREKWSELMKSAENARVLLLQEKRSALEQELDKQVKTFVVEVIRFRNAFDAQGPSVAGIEPLEAVRRLVDFQKQYDSYDTRRKTLDSISILFGLQCKPFPELDKTGEELVLLNLLYKVYQKFLTFDKLFRSTLWSDVDLVKATDEINQCWSDFLELPDKLKENWDAYFDLKNALQKYINVLPIVSMLNAKEIRNRHWLQVMAVTKSSFQLESALFKLHDIVDIGLELFKTEIEEICKAAKKEQELETKMRTIEEEWNEQVLSFVNYKEYGEVCLDKYYTERLLEQLDDAQESLVSMLTSKYIGPLRDEVSSWSEKLKTIGDVLELWIEVQELWINNEAIFTNPAVIKEMPAEAKRFQRVDKSWLRSQKQSFDMKSVLQCCLGSSVQENTKRILLKDIQKELETCTKSLNVYLEKKRRLFPRFYFLSNSSLLTLLSHPNDLTSVKPFLSSLFSSISDIRLEEVRDKDEEEKITVVSSASLSDRQRKSVHMSDTGSVGQNSNAQYEATEVLSIDGDSLQLHKRILVEKNVEGWLNRLKESVADSLKRYLNNALYDMCISAIPIEELALKYPTQICLVALNYVWTKEAVLIIHDIKNDRKAVGIASKKFIQVLTKLLNALSRNKWSTVDKPILYVHKLRLEAMVTFCMYLKDAFEGLANRRVRDVFDFEWQRCFRVYLVDENVEEEDYFDSVENIEESIGISESSSLSLSA